MNTTMDSRKAQGISRLFRVLGDPTRLKIMQLLLKEKGVCVGEIAEKLNVSTPAASQHLKLLELHGLLQPVRTGQRICYEPNREIERTNVLIKTIQSLEEE